VHELRNNQETDLQTFYQKENVHSKTVESLSFQVSNLRNAMGTLADVISEEIEHLRRVVLAGDIEQRLVQTHLRMEQFSMSMTKQDNEVSRVSYELEAIRDEVVTIRAREGRRWTEVEKRIDEGL